MLLLNLRLPFHASSEVLQLTNPACLIHACCCLSPSDQEWEPEVRPQHAAMGLNIQWLSAWKLSSLIFQALKQ